MPEMPQMPQMQSGPGGPGGVAPGPEGMPDPSMQPQMPQPGDNLGQDLESPMEDMGEMGEESDDKLANAIAAIISDMNIARKYKNKKDKEGRLILEQMGEEIYRAYDEDEKSRSEWMDKNKEWLKLATLFAEPKTYPWPKASNVKYPLLATAAMQFSARAYPALVPSDGNVVKTKITRANPDDALYQAAMRVSDHMSFQLMERIPNWEEDMDKLLMIISITGLAFKKTYHSTVDGCHRSDLVLADKLVVNYHAKNLDQAYRVTEILEYNNNEIEEKFRNDEEFLKFDLCTPPVNSDKDKSLSVAESVPPQPDKSTPHVFLSCHTYWDLDDDGYEEPYIITIHKETKKVVRIVARFDPKGVKYSEKNEIVKITPISYFTDFPFIPNPDGSIYALGFGILLGPLNESVNTLINQLVDAGTLNNLQAGFIGKGLRIRMGATTFTPGEWKSVNATGDDLSKQIFPLPTKEPSSVLFNLIQLLLTSGNQLASIAEIFVGKMPGQNTPASTTQETVQQSMAVFTAIYKRVYRSLDKEFKKLYRLNRIYPEAMFEEGMLAGIQLNASDYDLPDWAILPGADPTGDSGTVKMAKLQQVGQLISLGTINVQDYTRRVLDANEIPNPQTLIAQPQPPAPDPKIQTEQLKQQTLQMKGQMDQQKGQADIAKSQAEMELKKQLGEIQLQQKQADLELQRQKQAMDLQGQQMQQRMDMMSQVMEQHHQARTQQNEMAVAQAKSRLDLSAAAQSHKQKLSQGEESHKAKLKQQATAKPKGKTKKEK